MRPQRFTDEDWPRLPTWAHWRQPEGWTGWSTNDHDLWAECWTFLSCLAVMAGNSAGWVYGYTYVPREFYPPAIYTPGMPRSWSESQYDTWTDQVAQELTLQGFEDWCESRAEAEWERRYTP